MLVNRHRRLFSSIVRLSAIAAAMLMVTILVVTNSEAAFTATTTNTTNAFTTGSVILTDDDSDTALFNATALSPGVPVTECIVVTYQGSLTPADVRLYATVAGGLAQYVDTTIEVGTGGSFGDCTGFAAGPTIFNDTLNNLPVDWGTGLAVYTATGNPDARTLRFTVDVQNLPAAQSNSATADFTWEARD